ncbi:hypothetical protein [Frankia sp. Cr1]|uniref:hypothetical protein n=1 Tax=Frankia sp. Cr1 TaxID=3073931 RepID=UPI002AD280A7|nr:hypothetical protein [Frankia sp. Cr1]
MEADKSISRLVRYVLAAYIGSIGVRYEWSVEGLAERSQFFHYPNPIINRFEDELAVCEGRTRDPGLFTSLLRWASQTSE